MVYHHPARAPHNGPLVSPPWCVYQSINPNSFILFADAPHRRRAESSLDPGRRLRDHRHRHHHSLGNVHLLTSSSSVSTGGSLPFPRPPVAPDSSPLSLARALYSSSSRQCRVVTCPGGFFSYIKISFSFLANLATTLRYAVDPPVLS